MTPELASLAQQVKGFMPHHEGLALYRAARAVASRGPLVEIGAYCGKSAVYLGAAAAEAGGVLFTVDHHRGSEEMQAGWEHHDPDLVDPRTGRFDSLPQLRRTLERAGLEDVVVAVVGDSVTIAAHWSDAALVFIDGGHGPAPAHADYEAWSPRVMPGGLLAIHDVFPDPAHGGRPPYEIWLRARDDGYLEHAAVGSLRVLQKRETVSGPVR
ncbi:class I SAM-dependent methyltransferase [Candidatus Poriferisodalis sp.]|uniref:class I SAM-dependent methyltransferase n=1 Tax=Candidatus Poriferisodalis sp. TaxID=3101277 RepID=UPI003B020993